LLCCSIGDARSAFVEMLDLIRGDLEKPKSSMRGRASSGSYISPLIKLAMALRFLAGGIYLDIAFGYNVSYKHITEYVWEVLELLDGKLDNIQFPLDDEVKMRDLEKDFNACCGSVPGSGAVFPGTVAAGDGVVFRMQRPPADQVDGDVASFFTRKGYYAYGMQAFVDAHCRFVSISMKLCASAHDSTAYIVSGIAEAIRDGKLPNWAHIVLDEAYVCRQQELSPYRSRQLNKWQDSFNFHLSKCRQVVERAFGLLIQRWGVFWRPLRVSVARIPLLIRVACKLHNVCINSFGTASPVVASRDIRSRDIASALFTDGTGGGRGRRSDLEESDRRDMLTRRLETLGIERPARSQFSRVARV
jgi:hypothetical protein